MVEVLLFFYDSLFIDRRGFLGLPLDDSRRFGGADRRARSSSFRTSGYSFCDPASEISFAPATSFGFGFGGLGDIAKHMLFEKRHLFFFTSLKVRCRAACYGRLEGN